MTSGIEAKVAIGDLTVDVGQVIRNLTGVETDRDKKSILQKNFGQNLQLVKNKKQDWKILWLTKMENHPNHLKV